MLNNNEYVKKKIYTTFEDYSEGYFVNWSAYKSSIISCALYWYISTFSQYLLIKALASRQKFTYMYFLMTIPPSRHRMPLRFLQVPFCPMCQFLGISAIRFLAFPSYTYKGSLMILRYWEFWIYINTVNLNFTWLQ